MDRHFPPLRPLREQPPRLVSNNILNTGKNNAAKKYGNWLLHVSGGHGLSLTVRFNDVAVQF